MGLQNVDSYLHRNENVFIKLRQSCLSSISPDTVVLTDKRVIIIHNSFFGLYFHHNIISPTRVSTVLLDNIMGTTTTTGRLLSTVHVRIRGSGEESVTPDTGWHIDGLRSSSAVKLANIIVELLESKSEKVTYVDMEALKSIMASEGSGIVWLGTEQSDYVAYIVGVDKSKVVRVNPADVSSLSHTGLRYFEGKVLVCYNGSTSSELAALLKSEYSINAYVLRGGLAEAVGSKGRDNNVSADK